MGGCNSMILLTSNMPGNPCNLANSNKAQNGIAPLPSLLKYSVLTPGVITTKIPLPKEPKRFTVKDRV